MVLNIAKNLAGPGGKVIFFTGSNDDDRYYNRKMIEVVDVLHPTLVCKTNGILADVIYGAAGGKIGNDVLFCGGRSLDEVRLNECYILGNEEPFIKMNDKREYASGVVLSNGTFMIIGKFQENASTPTRFFSFFS